jgi:NADH dehydrogenase
MSTRTHSPRIVIVGGGTAGLLLATRLGRQLGKPGHARITLVDRSLTHLWKPMLHTIAAGTRDVHQHKVSLLAQARTHGFGYEPGELCGIDRETRQVHLTALPDAASALVGARSLPYDVLVLALGSGANDFGVPGVQAHCHFIDNPTQAESFNERLRWQLFRGALQDESVSIGIVGAGATGVELAAELSHLLELAAHFGDPSLRERLQLTLYESAPRILAAFPERVSESSHRVLDRVGFQIRTGTRVLQASADGLTTAQTPLHSADMLVWAAGIKAPEVLSRLDGLPTNASHQVVVNAALQSTDDDHVFALGDCSTLTLPDQSRPLPASAQVAVQQATHLAKHLPGWLQGRAIPAFRYRDLGSLVSLGRYGAYGSVGKASPFAGQFLGGHVARLGHELVYRNYQRALHGLGKTSLLWATEGLNSWPHPGIRLS